MAQNVHEIGHSFGQIKITGQTTAHLGDHYRYGDTIRISQISNASFFTCNVSDAVPNNKTDTGTIAFVQSAELTLKYVPSKKFFQSC